MINWTIGKQLVETKLNHDWLKEMADEYQDWDKKGDESLICLAVIKIRALLANYNTLITLHL